MEFSLGALVTKLHGWDAVVYGDNHKGFLREAGKNGSIKVFNCGTLMRRKTDEVDYKPQVGLLLDDGEVVSYKLDISQDVLDTSSSTHKAEGLEAVCELGSFMDELKGLQKTELDFVEALNQAMNKFGVRPEVRKIILEARGNG